VSEPQGSLFPVAALDANDPRFAVLVKRVGALVEEVGFGRVTYSDRVDIGAALFGVIYGTRGAAGELERRLNGTDAPLVDEEGKLDSYECAAVAHELRRVKGADGAIVIAVDARNRVHIGVATPNAPGSQTDLLAARLMRQIDEVAHDRIQDVVLDLVVTKKGQAS
jgi:hypothetical protein